MVYGQRPMRVRAEALRVRRLQAALTQAELAHRAGLSTAHIAKLEQGRRHGSIRSIRQIASALDCTVDEIAEVVVTNV